MAKYLALSLALPLAFPIGLPTPQRILLSNGILLSALASRPAAQNPHLAISY